MPPARSDHADLPAGGCDWRIAARLLPYLWTCRHRVAIALVLLVAARLANVSVPLVLKRIIEDLETPGLVAVPIALLVAYGSLRFSAILFAELQNLAFTKAGTRIVRHVSTLVFSHLHQLSLGFHLDRKIGGLSRDMDRGSMAITGFLQMFVFGILPVVMEITLVMLILWRQMGPRYALVTMALVTLYCLFTFAVTRWRSRLRIRMNRAESTASTHLLDSLINYETVKVFGNEAREQERYRRSLETWSEESYRNSASLSLLNTGQGLIVAVGLSILMIMAAADVREGVSSLGELVMVNAFLIQLYIPLNVLGSVYRELNQSLIDMERVFGLLDERPAITDSPGAAPLECSAGEIAFHDVSFGYRGDRAILEDISLTVRGGEMVAVVGPSGAGKSTLARLLLRFYDPDSGRVEIDGQDIRHVTQESLRAEMAVVPQDTVLFNDTIGYNIAYGHPDATQQEIDAAARIAQLDGFIRQQPQGYETLVGERGLKLSGGEKQRVAIARSALKGARILVFDEATSSLDSRSERGIQGALDRIAENTTTLIIAHRLSTIISADQIIVLERGRIVERGVHAELVERDGLYRQMWELQQQES